MRRSVWRLVATIACIVLACCICRGQTEQLNGTISYANGTKFNGTIQLSIAKSTIVNTCVTPAQVISISLPPIQVINGVLSFNSNPVLVWPTPCLSPHLPYFMQMYDTLHNSILTDNWYIPQTASGAVDIGTLIATNYASGITVSLPNAIVSSPAGAQTITQPGGTNLTVNNLTVTNPINGTIPSLSGSPTQCNGTTQWATGISANGNAQCATVIVGSGVSSFNSRTGAVVPTSGDYNYSQITGTPTIYYQTIYANTLPATQEPRIQFSPAFRVVDNPPYTSIDLPASSAGGTYSISAIGSITFDNFGIATSISPPSNPCGSNLGTNCDYSFASGVMYQWGTTGDLLGGSANISFPVTFPHNCFGVQATTLSSTDRITYVNNISTSGFTVSNNGSGADAMWFAVGN